MLVLHCPIIPLGNYSVEDKRSVEKDETLTLTHLSRSEGKGDLRGDAAAFQVLLP